MKGLGLTPFTELCDGIQSCIWFFHINLTEKNFWKFSVKLMWRMRNTTTASEKQLLWLIGWITADGTNFFEILVPFPFFPRFQIYARSGDLIRISKDNQEKKLSFLCHMASKQQSLQLIGWITADGTNFFEILASIPFFSCV